MPKDAEACRHHSRTAGCRGGRERIAKEEARLARSGWAWVLRALHFELPLDGPSGNHQLSESCVPHLDDSSPNPSLENGLDFNPV